MTQLQFQIIFIPKVDEEPDVKLLQKYLESCGLVIQERNRVQCDKTKQPVCPDISEYIVDIKAKLQAVIGNRNKIDVYKDFISKWCKLRHSRFNERPLLRLSDDECFISKRVSCHSKLVLQNVSFGVQARLGEYVSYATIGENSEANFFHDLKELEILIHSSVDEKSDNIPTVETKYSLKISYTQIRNVIISVNDKYFELFLDLQYPPLFFKVTREKGGINSRIVRTENRVLPFGVDRLVVGKSNIVLLKLHYIDTFYEILSCLRYGSGKIPIHFIKMSVKCKPPPTVSLMNFNHFNCSYMWAAIVNRTFLLLEQADDIIKSLDTLLRYSEENSICLEIALTTVLSWIDKGRFLNYWNVIDKLFAHYVGSQKGGLFKDISIPKKCHLIRRAVITPTRILLWPADLMHENRILRNFDPEFFMRVTFRDDDYSPMNFRMYDTSVFETVVTNPVNSGIVIGKRNYQILAWSNSQLREHGVSMYATDSSGITAHDIRKWTEIDPKTPMNIPKCLSRIGQCFSQTEDTLHVPLDDAHVIFDKDIERGNNPETSQPYVFSDGIGRISANLVAKIKKTFRHNTECSAFQIRYSGCKGMLVLDPTLREADIVFRESMRKFDCRGYDHTKLEIVKKSGPSSLCLNRPLIAILHDLDVKVKVFLRLQEIMLQNLIYMLLKEETAVSYLKTRTPFPINFKTLSASGIYLTREPFFRTLLLALHRYDIDFVKKKANIDIDPNYGRNMFGVLDETGILEYGQVFVQYSADVSKGKTTPDDTKIVKGTVMVTKSPCVHPADVRKFTAVDVPQLHHIIDCIVFPQKGPRPHPDEMAGSDLDGDEYSVIWMPELIFDRANAVPPNYPKPDTQNFRNVSDFLSHSRTEEIANFLVNYIQNDNISIIANSHLAQSDQLSVHDPICLGIAKKFAIAVDFPKTGVSTQLSRREKPWKFPDFMEKFWRKRYMSKKSLGKMYAISKDFELDNRPTFLQYHNIELDPTLIVDGWQKFEQSAMASRDEYNNALRTILQIYGIAHETEAFGGSFLRFHARFRGKKDRDELVDDIHRWLKELIGATRTKFYESTPGSQVCGNIVADVERKASAWYVVTYRESDPEFLSFPWVVSDILGDICKVKLKLHSKTPIVFKLEEQIIENADAGMLPNLGPVAESLLKGFNFLCERSIVERAISVLTKWANDEGLISTTQAGGKFLSYETFIKLILYVFELKGAVSKTHSQIKTDASSSGLCMLFFEYCMQLRFLSLEELKNKLPFDVYNDRWLTKSALMAFHNVAVNGVLPTMCSRDFMNNASEFVDMKVVSVDSSVLGSSPIEESKLRTAESRLQKFSGVEHVVMREDRQRQKIIIDAYGSFLSVRQLRWILIKESYFLQQFFTTGTLP